MFEEAADMIQMVKEGVRNELEEFDEALMNFRLASLEQQGLSQPGNKIADIIRRRL